MSLSTWLFGLRGKRKPRRQPVRPTLFLERLEERMVPSTTASFLQGPANNPNINFGPQNQGLLVAQFPNSPFLNAPQATGTVAQATPNPTQTYAIGAMDSTLAQDLRIAEFRMMGINSQGQNGNVSMMPPWYNESVGLGSGVMPGRPWMLAYMGQGLANSSPALGIPGISSGIEDWGMSLGRQQLP